VPLIVRVGDAAPVDARDLPLLVLQGEHGVAFEAGREVTIRLLDEQAQAQRTLPQLLIPV